MKRLSLALLVTAATLAATSARADTRIRIGVHVGAPAYVPAPPVVVYAPASSYCPPPAPVHYAPRGYWKEIVVKTWVPGCWVTTRDECGRLVRVHQPGYFTYRTDRVWVDGREHHYGYHDYGRGDWRR